MKCAFFGTTCSRIHIVPVPIERGDRPIVRATDLAFQSYIQFDVSQNTLVFDLDRFVMHVDRYPSNGGIPCPHRFAIIQSHHVSVPTRLERFLRFAFACASQTHSQSVHV